MNNVENAELKLRVDALEKENRELKRSVFELSNRLSQLQWLLMKAKSRPFEVERQPELRPKSEEERLLVTPISVTPSDTQQPREEKREDPHSPGTENPSAASKALGRDLNLLLNQKDQRKVHSSSELRSFQCTADYLDHNGAVYCCAWSPCGSLLASGSFDKKVIVRIVGQRIRSATVDDLYENTIEEDEGMSSTLVLSGHNQLVADIKWSNASDRLVSASFDHTVKLWQLERAPTLEHEKELGSSAPDLRGWLLQSYAVEGLVQTVEMDLENGNLFWAGTSKGSLVRFDARTGKVAGTLANGEDGSVALDSMLVQPLSRANVMINSLHIPSSSPFQLLAGDSRGVVRTFDWRMNSPIRELTFLNEAAGRPITHITSTYGSKHRKLLAVNSYDNILRVYDRSLLSRGNSVSPVPPRGDTPPTGSSASHQQPTQHQAVSQSVGTEQQASLSQTLKTHTPLYSLTGHRNKNWPIKSSFFCDPESQDARLGSMHSPRLPAGSSPGMLPVRDADQVGPGTLLATGSASTSLYVFGLYGNGETSLVQKLRGHSGRVYACDFSRADSSPILASCSADSGVKVWSLRKVES